MALANAEMKIMVGGFDSVFGGFFVVEKRKRKRKEKGKGVRRIRVCVG